jgi:hypothetical protein
MKPFLIKEKSSQMRLPAGRECALNHEKSRAAMRHILNYVAFRTNHEPYVVRGVVHGGVANIQSKM